MRIIVLFVELILPAMAFFALGVVSTLAVQKHLRRREARIAHETARKVRIEALKETPTEALLEEISTRDADDLAARQDTRK